MNRIDLIYEVSKCKYDFCRFQTIRSFCDCIFTGNITINEANKKQSNLLDVFLNFNNKDQDQKQIRIKKSNTYESANVLYQGWELTPNGFKSGIFPIKSTQGQRLKIATLKQMLLRLPIALAQVQAGNTSENLLNEICQRYILCIKQKKLLKNKWIQWKYNTKWILYLWILKIVKHLNLIDYYLILKIK